MNRISYQPRPSSAAAFKRTHDHRTTFPSLLSRQTLRELVAHMID